jgi:hypothetical protein
MLGVYVAAPVVGNSSKAHAMAPRTPKDGVPIPNCHSGHAETLQNVSLLKCRVCAQQHEAQRDKFHGQIGARVEFFLPTMLILLD